MSGDQMSGAPDAAEAADGAGARGTTPAGAEPSASAGAAAGAIPAGAVPSTDEPIPAQSQAVTDPATAEVAATAPAADQAAADAVAARALAPATPVVSPFRRRGLALVAAASRVARFAVMLGLFAVGVAIGYQSYLTSQPVPTGPAVDPATAGNQPAPVIRELIAAVGTNDADRIRSSMPSEPYKLFTSEMQRWEFKEVTSVETLATYEDGTRTATSFVMLGRDLAGNPIAMTLVAETQDGNIVGFK